MDDEPPIIAFEPRRSLSVRTKWPANNLVRPVLVSSAAPNLLRQRSRQFPQGGLDNPIVKRPDRLPVHSSPQPMKISAGHVVHPRTARAILLQHPGQQRVRQLVFHAHSHFPRRIHMLDFEKSIMATYLKRLGPVRSHPSVPAKSFPKGQSQTEKCPPNPSANQLLARRKLRKDALARRRNLCHVNIHD